MKYLLLAALIFSAQIKAEGFDSTHKAAHFGISYAADTFLYGFSKKALHLTSTEAFIFSTFTVLVTGAAYKMIERHPEKTFGDAMFFNALGTATFGVTAVVFDF